MKKAKRLHKNNNRETGQKVYQEKLKLRNGQKKKKKKKREEREKEETFKGPLHTMQRMRRRRYQY